jgi:hypothetical protein
MSTIIINGKQIISNSGNISISNGKVIIDGVEQTDDSKTINVVINGNINNLDIDYASSIEVNGDVNTVNSKNGNIVCGNVTSNVESKNGNIKCGNVGGDVNTKNGNISKN